MTVTLTISPEVEAALLARARAEGMNLQDHIRSVVEHEALRPTEEPMASDSTRRRKAVRRMIEFGERHHLSLGEPITREWLHEGHRF